MSGVPQTGWAVPKTGWSVPQSSSAPPEATPQQPPAEAPANAQDDSVPKSGWSVPKTGWSVPNSPNTDKPTPLVTPHKYDRAIADASKPYGLDPSILRAVGMQESGLGSGANYDPKTGLDRDGNKGRGLFQLDPASGASKADLERAAKDPAFAAQRAARMIAKAKTASGGNIRAALAIYNSGSATSPEGLAYAAQVLDKQKSLDPIDTDPEMVQQIKHDYKTVNSQIKAGKPLDVALGRTTTATGLRNIEAQHHISWKWAQNHPLEAVNDFLGAGQHALGGFEYQKSIGKSNKDALASVRDYVWNPTQKRQNEATEGPANVINKFLAKSGKGHVPSHDEIDAFIKAHHTGALQPYYEAIANGTRDFGLQTISDPAFIADRVPLLAAHAALGTAQGMFRAAHELAKAKGAGKILDHLDTMANVAEKTKDIFGTRRDLDRAGFTEQGKGARQAIENAEINRQERNRSLDEKVVNDTRGTAERYLHYVREHGDRMHSDQASELLGLENHVSPTGHHVTGNIQSRIQDIVSSTPKERKELLSKVRNNIAVKSANQKTNQMLASNPKYFKGQAGNISQLTLQDESKGMKLLRDFGKLNPVGDWAKNAIMWNPMPHGIKNVGTLAYMAGGIPAVIDGLIGIAKGVDPAVAKRLEDMGATSVYAGKATSGYGKAMHAALERTELGWRAGLLKVLDDKLGPSKPGSVEEMLKGHMISKLIGDYRNQSAFVEMFKALGGPFVAFRLGIAPGNTARALLHTPERIKGLERAKEDVQNNRSSTGKFNNTIATGGPDEDAFKAVINLKAFLASPSTEGPLSALNSNQATDDQGFVGQLIDLAGAYIPAIGGAYDVGKIAEGAGMPGVHGPQKSSWADKMVEALGGVGLGMRVEKNLAPKTERAEYKKIRKKQTI